MSCFGTESCVESETQLTSRPWPQCEEELFDEIQKTREGNEQNSSEVDELQNMITAEATFGVEVDPAEEAYNTPRRDKDSEIPSSTEDTDDTPSQPPEPTPPPPETPEDVKVREEDTNDVKVSENGTDDVNGVIDSHVSDDKDDGIQDGQPAAVEHETGNQSLEEKENDDKPNFFVNILITFAAFVVAVILVTFYLIKDIVPMRTSVNFRRHWEQLMSNLLIMPTFIPKLYEELFIPLKTMQADSFKSRAGQPKIIVTQNDK